MDNSLLVFTNGAQPEPHGHSSTQLPLAVYSQDRVAKICESPPNSPILAKKAKTAWKKPKDYPRRPLSAYNLFFQSERQNLITIRDQEAIPFTKKKGIGGFAGLARAIATKWKALDEDERSPFEDHAKLDRIRYKAEVKMWKNKHVAKRKSKVQHQPADSTSFDKEMLYFSPPQIQSSVIPLSSVTPERLQVLNNSSQTTRMLLKQLFAVSDFNAPSRAISLPQKPRSLMSHPMTLEEILSPPTTFSEHTLNVDHHAGDGADECFYQAPRHVVTPPLEKPVISFEHAVSSSCWDELVEHFGGGLDDDTNPMSEPIVDDDFENFFERLENL